jgi:hypothetical protein
LVVEDLKRARPVRRRTILLADPASPEALAYLERGRRPSGYIANLERAWAWRPDVADAFGTLRSQLIDQSNLAPPDVAFMECATASALGDSHCSLAWGG